MQLNTQDLAGKLRGIIGDDELASALCEAAENVHFGDQFEGAPEEFAKAVTDRMKADNPNLKWPSGAIANRARMILAEAWVADSQHEDEDSADDESPPEVVPAHAKVISAPETQADISEEGEEPETILVELPDKIKAYGGGFYDAEQGLWIKGKEPVEVKKTNFVMQKIANKELLEVKQ